MKKILALIMAIAMTMCFVGCGETDTSKLSSSEINKLFSDPDEYKGRTVEMTGQVFQVENDDNTLFIQMWYDIKNYDKNVVVLYDNSDNSLDLETDDYIKIEGSIAGEFSGENAYGGDISAPQITATKIEKILAAEAFPAVTTMDVGQTVEQGGIKATLTKTDWTKNSTRMYITVENTNSSTIDVYPDDGAVVQNGKQYKPNWNDAYGTYGGEIQPGASVDYIIEFDKLEESSFSYTFDGYDDDYNELTFNWDISVK